MTGVRSGSSERYTRDTEASQIICKEHRRQQKRFAALIEPNWILLFSRKRGRWWVRLLACGRYHHVKAIAYLPAMRAWVFYDVKFNGTRLMLAHEDDSGTRAFLRDYLDSCDLIAMPRLPIPKRVAPHAGFWCTLAMKHLVGVRAAALRPDRLWRVSLAVGGKSYVCWPGEGSRVALASVTPPNGPQPPDGVLSFLQAHAQTTSDPLTQQCWIDDAAFGRQRSVRVERLQARIRALRDKATSVLDSFTPPPQQAVETKTHDR
jgi:hypothetical protein